MDKYYLTEERLEEIKAELENMKTTKRQEVAERLKQAKEYGDLSENSEYAEARDEQSRVETRIFELEEIVKHAAIITQKATGETVTIGSTVTAKKGPHILHYEIVGSDEAKPEQGKISNESPLGRALLGRKVGETVSVHTPGGEIEYQITRIV